MIGNFDQTSKKRYTRSENIYMKMKIGRNNRRNDQSMSKSFDNWKRIKTISIV